MKGELSKKEVKLFASCGASHMVKLVDNDAWTVANLYSNIGEHAFRYNVDGLRKESLLRILTAWHNCRPHRNTKEFDDLIQL